MGCYYSSETYCEDIKAPLLVVPDNATLFEINRAFRKLSPQYHPDRGGDAEKYKQLTQEYGILFDKLRSPR